MHVGDLSDWGGTSTRGPASGLRRLWTWLTDDHVVFTTDVVHRHFMRCDTCGAVFAHYWGCPDPGEEGRPGCRKCGGIRAKLVRLPEWQAAWYVLSRYVWRKLIWRRTFWDPRMPTRVTHAQD